MQIKIIFLTIMASEIVAASIPGIYQNIDIGVLKLVMIVTGELLLETKAVLALAQSPVKLTVVDIHMTMSAAEYSDLFPFWCSFPDVMVNRMYLGCIGKP